MSSLQAAIDDFLAQKRIAVAGVSRSSEAPANLIFRKLRDSGHEVFAINPAADEVEGTVAYPDLRAIPGGVEAVVACTPPAATEEIVRQCVAQGVPRVWMHRSLGAGSVSQRAVAEGRSQGLTVIPGLCPMMFQPPVDAAHRCMRWFLKGATSRRFEGAL